MSLFLAIFMLISILLSLPGIREDQELKDGYFREDIQPTQFFSEFVYNLRQSFQEKSFKIFIIVTISITVTSTLISASVPYYVEYVLGIGVIANPVLYGQMLRTVNFPFILTSVFLIPVYFYIIRKFGHMKSFKYALIVAGLPLLLVFFSLSFGSTNSLPLVMLGAGLYGISGGILVISRIPVMGDFFDESAIKYKKRQEGVYLGIWNFFSRLVTVIQFGILVTIQNLTGFAQDPFSILAKWGIMTHFGLIPAIFLIIAGVVFWKYWYLTPEKTEMIKDELEKLGI